MDFPNFGLLRSYQELSRGAPVSARETSNPRSAPDGLPLHGLCALVECGERMGDADPRLRAAAFGVLHQRPGRSRGDRVPGHVLGVSPDRFPGVRSRPPSWPARTSETRGVAGG